MNQDRATAVHTIFAALRHSRDRINSTSWTHSQHASWLWWAFSYIWDRIRRGRVLWDERTPLDRATSTRYRSQSDQSQSSWSYTHGHPAADGDASARTPATTSLIRYLSPLLCFIISTICSRTLLPDRQTDRCYATHPPPGLDYRSRYWKLGCLHRLHGSANGLATAATLD